jgi:predicted GNAT superfamily acetyltransferase
MDRIDALPDLRTDTALRPAALALNAAHERETGPLDAVAFDALLAMAFAAPAIVGQDGRLAAFMVALGPGTAYASPNYAWVSARFGRFVYVDRVVVAPEARGLGLGRRLYDAVSAAARDAGLGRIVCEVNIVPPNPGSLAFHSALGFLEIGRAVLADRGKTVAYLARELAD